MLRPLEAISEVLLEPLLIDPLMAESAEVIDKALFPVDRILPEARVNVPVPLLSESAFRLVVPLVVTSSLSVMPLAELNVVAPPATAPFIVMTPAVRERALAPEDRVLPEARVNVPVPLLSVSALTVVESEPVKLSLSVIPPTALRVDDPDPVIPPVVASSDIEVADVRVTPLAMVMLSPVSAELSASPSSVKAPVSVVRFPLMAIP